MAAPELGPGVLLVDKPAGPTSHDVVLEARRALGERRVGHTGTLDPFATGLLLLCVGRCTRLASLFHLLPKRYRARIRLGVETDTLDATGSVTGRSDAWRDVGPATVLEALRGLEGEILQVPPAFSAKKAEGRRAHSVARSGETPRLRAVTVLVHRLAVDEFRPPVLEVTADVGTGTYVRALARDLGRALGCGAHLEDLRRTDVGPFAVERALSATRLQRAAGGDAVKLGAAWLTPADALAWLPARLLDDDEVVRVGHGREVPLGEVSDPAVWGRAGEPADLPVALLSGDELIAIARRDGEVLRPVRVLHAA